MQPDNESKHDLDALYAKRKSQHKSPASLKKQILLSHQQSLSWSKVFNRMTYMATAACTLLLFGVFMLQTQSPQPVTPDNLVYLHSLDTQLQSSTNQTQRLATNQKYVDAYRSYLNQEQTFALHHSKQAKLLLTPSGWKLTTCDDQALLVAQSLINELTRVQQIELGLNSGDVVDIAFAQNGIVLGIQSSPQPMICS
jgi:hypothetical protein